VARAKEELLEGMAADGTAVLNADDRYFDALRARFAGRTLSFGITRPADVRATDIEQRQDGTMFRMQAQERSSAVRLRTVGLHNVVNALAAAAAALAVGMPLDAVGAGLEEFRPAAMRTEVLEVQGRTVLADCYNANPASMQAALQALTGMAGSRRAIAVLGDMLELGEASDAAHREVGTAVARSGAVLLIAVGELGRLIAEGARQAGMDPDRVLTAGTTGRAAELLRDRSRVGDVVLVKGSRGMRMETILEGF
jgi:UDP-N-acetylmuramoyl-tripeptide--D-alanyl-D-alanine ligase